jgi:Asp-tRNA(Asn)/Glu-tRNA(Gln) amidotransferase C subunit
MSDRYEQQVREFQRILQQRIKFLDEQKSKKEKEQLQRMIKRVSEYLENLNKKDVEINKPKVWRKGRIRT